MRKDPRKKAKELAKYLREERPDYHYLKAVFRHLRAELNIEVERNNKALPEVPTEEELKKFYDVVWKARNTQDLLIIKILLYTGARVSELVGMKLTDVDLDLCQIRIRQGKGGKDRVVPFPDHFKETVAQHMAAMKTKGASFLFESSWKKPYSDRGIRKMLERYAEDAGLERSFSPHKMRHFLLSWLKKQGIDDALIQPYSGHASRKSLEVYSRLSLSVAQDEYNIAIKKFPV